MCKYCLGDVEDRKYIAEDIELSSDISLYVDGNNLLDMSDETGFSVSIEVNYCPMCGRKLVD